MGGRRARLEARRGARQHEPEDISLRGGIEPSVASALDALHRVQGGPASGTEKVDGLVLAGQVFADHFHRVHASSSIRGSPAYLAQAVQDHRSSELLNKIRQD